MKIAVNVINKIKETNLYTINVFTAYLFFNRLKKNREEQERWYRDEIITYEYSFSY